MVEDDSGKNVGIFSQKAVLSINEQAITINSTDVKAAASGTSKGEVQPVFTLLDNTLQEQGNHKEPQHIVSSDKVEGSNKEPETGRGDEAIKYIQESLMNMVDTPIRGDPLLDVEDMMLGSLRCTKTLR